MVMKVVVVAIVLSVSFAGQALANVEITPDNMDIPTLTGELFSFDFVISNPDGISAQAFETRISLSGPGSLDFNSPMSTAVNAEADYWLSFANSLPGAAQDGSSYKFSDFALNTTAEPLAVDDIVSRYAFIWDGTAGDYTFTLDLNIANSFVLLGDFVTSEALQFSPGNYPGDSSSFTVTIPELATLLSVGLGGALLVRKRKA